MKFDSLLAMADHQMKYKYVVKNVAGQARQDRDVHAQAALRRQRLGHALPPVDLEGRQAAVRRRHRLCRPVADVQVVHRRPAAHAPAILAFAAPTTNSYRRLVPGYEAPVNLAWSLRNRSAACRIPMYSDSPKAKRVEFRCPDPSCNPYLAFAAMLMAGLDGIKNKIDPGDPVDKNIYDLPPEEAAEIKQVPGSLEASLAALEADHEFLLEGDVFTRRPDRDLHRLQALVGGRPDPPAAAPVRVLPLLRPLIGAGRPACREPAGACSDRPGAPQSVFQARWFRPILPAAPRRQPLENGQRCLPASRRPPPCRMRPVPIGRGSAPGTRRGRPGQVAAMRKAPLWLGTSRVRGTGLSLIFR